MGASILYAAAVIGIVGILAGILLGVASEKFKVKVDDNVNGEKILNKANVVDGSNKFDTNETTNPTSTKPKKDVFSPSDDKVSIDGNEVKAGQELLYKVTYKNTTGKDQKVVIKDKIPEHTTYVKGSASNKGVYKDGEITWTKEKVADGEIFEPAISSAYF
jgi:uncharacterized repeat protein (TIGR01451 family)